MPETLGHTLDDLNLPLTTEQSERLLSRVRDLVSAERDRAVSLCRRRAELWETTDLARSTAALAREEARARTNEALYLADLIASP